MKCFYVLSMVLAVAIAQEKYELKTQNFPIEEVAADKDVLRSYLQCFIDEEIEKNCVGFAAELKKNARDAVEHGCVKCTDEQKHIVNVVMTGFAEKLPQDYERFKAFYDPKGNLVPALIQAVAGF